MLVGRFGADDDRAGHVGAVPVDLGADVDQQEVTGFDRPAARTGVGQGGVGTRGDDRLVAAVLGAQIEHVALDPTGEVAFGVADLDGGEQFGQGDIRDGGGSFEASDLGRFLHLAEPGHGTVGRFDGGVDPLIELGSCRHRQVVGLDPDRGAVESGEGRLEVGGHDRGDELGESEPLEVGGELGPIPVVGGDDDVVEGHHHRCVRRDEAGEPANVHRRGDPHCVEIVGGELGADPFEAGRPIHRRERGRQVDHGTRSRVRRSRPRSSMRTGSTPSGPSRTKVTPSSAFLSRANRSTISSRSSPFGRWGSSS